jgi:hypothetical protein
MDRMEKRNNKDVIKVEVRNGKDREVREIDVVKEGMENV